MFLETFSGTSPPRLSLTSSTSKQFLEESLRVPWTRVHLVRAPFLSASHLTTVLLHKLCQCCHWGLELARREILAANCHIWWLFPKLHCFSLESYSFSQTQFSCFRDHSHDISWIMTSPLSPLLLLSGPCPAQIRMSSSFFWLKTEAPCMYNNIMQINAWEGAVSLWQKRMNSRSSLCKTPYSIKIDMFCFWAHPPPSWGPSGCHVHCPDKC